MTSEDLNRQALHSDDRWMCVGCGGIFFSNPHIKYVRTEDGGPKTEIYCRDCYDVAIRTTTIAGVSGGRIKVWVCDKCRDYYTMNFVPKKYVVRGTSIKIELMVCEKCYELNQLDEMSKEIEDRP